MSSHVTKSVITLTKKQWYVLVCVAVLLSMATVVGMIWISRQKDDDTAYIGPNLMSNPGFEEQEGTLYPWMTTRSDVTKLSVVTDSETQSHVIQMEVMKAGGLADLAQSTVTLNAAEKYLLSFDVRAEGIDSLGLVLHKDTKNTKTDEHYGIDGSLISLTDKWQHITFPFQTTRLGGKARVSDAQLRFWIPPTANAGSRIWIDNIVLTRHFP